MNNQVNWGALRVPRDTTSHYSGLQLSTLSKTCKKERRCTPKKDQTKRDDLDEEGDGRDFQGVAAAASATLQKEVLLLPYSQEGFRKIDCL